MLPSVCSNKHIPVAKAHGQLSLPPPVLGLRNSTGIRGKIIKQINYYVS